MAGSIIRRRFIDIGANLTDPMYQGLYNGKQCHAADLKTVLSRAIQFGLEKIIITGGSLEDSEKALKVAKSDPMLYSTVGCHPTRCLELEDDAQLYIDSMVKLTKDNADKVVAVGEFGLDYDRLHFCPKEAQIKNFALQFEVAEKTKLPLFLHCRNAATDLLEILNRHRDSYTSGVVHSFDGTYEEAKSFLDLGLYIGLNGCSLKTDANLEVVQKLPIDRLLIETDCPWCEIKASHASSEHVQTKFESVKKEKWSEAKQVKGRNEPANIVQVFEVISKLKADIDADTLAQTIYENTQKVFFPNS